MANLNDVLQGLVNLNSKMANNINNLLDSIGEGFLDVGELTVENDVLSLQGATILVNGSNILVENLSTTFAGNRICFLEYKADKSIALKVLAVVDENFNYDLSQLDATSKHFEVARQYNGVLEDRRVASMASKDNTIVGALNGALKAIDYDNEMDLEINMDILSRVSAVESDIVDLDTKKADKTYVDEAVANVDIDGVVTAVDVGEVTGVENPYVTKEELDEALSGLDVDVDLTPYQEKSDDSLSTTDKTIVGAINELFQSANNGKELIASSIGEPLSVEDTFQAMSDDIDGLLSTFKTNMMSNGVTVEAGDKFKQLIDKLANLSDSEGKGLQFSSGELSSVGDNLETFQSDLNSETFEDTSFKSARIPINFDFSHYTAYAETLLKLPNDEDVYLSSVEFHICDTSSYVVDNKVFGYMVSAYRFIDADGNSISDYSDGHYWCDYYPIIDNKEIKIPLLSSLYGGTPLDFNLIAYTHYAAVGVGEEDTTLRDSLASILQEEGVEVTEEDDMASLISKVDEEFDRKNSSGGFDIISATELPATGKEGQICVITDNPVSDFIISPNMSDYDGSTSTICALTSTSGNGLDPVLLQSDGLKQYYYFDKMYQGNTFKKSYLYKNGAWVEYTPSEAILIKDGAIVTDAIFGGLTYPTGSDTDQYVKVTSSGVEMYFNTTQSDYYWGMCSTKAIDFSKFSTIKITHTNLVTNTDGFYVGLGRDYGTTDPNEYIGFGNSYYSQPSTNEWIYSGSVNQSVTDTIDISSWTQTGFLVIYYHNQTSGQKLRFTEITMY